MIFYVSCVLTIYGKFKKLFNFQILFFVKNIQDYIPFDDKLKFCSIYLLKLTAQSY
jgi:hypothetical protein